MNGNKWYIDKEGCEEKKSEAVPAQQEASTNPVPEKPEDTKETAMNILGKRIHVLQDKVEQLENAVHDQEMLRIREQATLQRDKSSYEARTKSALFLDLLSVVDSFEQLVQHGEETQDESSLLTGCRAVLGQLNQLLSRNGIRKLEGLKGKPYDASTSEIARVVSDTSAAPNAVIKVLRCGYKLGESLLRPAMVDVAAVSPAPVEGKEDADHEEGKSESDTSDKK